MRIPSIKQNSSRLAETANKAPNPTAKTKFDMYALVSASEAQTLKLSVPAALLEPRRGGGSGGHGGGGGGHSSAHGSSSSRSGAIIGGGGGGAGSGLALGGKEIGIIVGVSVGLVASIGLIAYCCNRRLERGSREPNAQTQDLELGQRPVRGPVQDA